jgi:large subunit ribosomal protein L9
MEVILTQDLKNLGYKDEVVKVKPGYGRNYLIPQGMAIQADSANKKMLAETQKQRAYKEDKIKSEATSMAETLKNITVSVGAKAGENGKIFGSVTTIQLAEALKKQGYNVDRRQITFDDDHIKTLGTYTANLNLHKEVKIKVNFEVVAE